MKIESVGARDGKLPLQLRAMINMAADNFARQLQIHNLKTNIKVRVHYRAILNKSQGMCVAISPREFVIDLCLYSNWITTLAHEMVHVKQFARKELSMDMRTWKNSPVSKDLAYWDYPWEHEAFRLQNQLIDEFGWDNA